MDSTGITDWLQSNVVPLILCVIGIIILAGARKFRLAEVMNIGIIALIGLIFIVAPVAYISFGEEIAGIVLPGDGGQGGGGGGQN